MSIDWITVIAQLVNFLVLVWLLHRFLYRPVLRGIAEREASISARMKAADDEREQALEDQERYRTLHHELTTDKDKAVADALASTRKERDEVMQRGRKALEEEQAQWRSQLDAERNEFLVRLQQTSAQTVSEITRKVLHDLADESLENAMARHFVQHVKPMAQELGEAAGAQQKGEISTHAALDNDVREALQVDLKTLLPDLTWTFVTDVRQTPGIILKVGGARVDWTLDSYMDEMERLLAQSAQREAAQA